MTYINHSIQIRNLTLKNRLVMPPMATSKSEKDGRVSDSLIQYYAEKSQGGYIGLIITEHSFIHPQGRASEGQMSICEDSCIQGLSQLADMIHSSDTKVFAQISHAGALARQTFSPFNAGPSDDYIRDEDVKEMTQAQIDEVIESFVSAALRAQKAGFDGVEIHGAHAYLLNQFYSPLRNRRTDAYTGHTIEGRLALIIQVIRQVRKATGPEYPIALRWGACDFMDGGSTIADAIEGVKLLEKEDFDLLDITGGLCFYTRPGINTPGYFSEITEAIKPYTTKPILLTGGIHKVEQAEALLAMNKADMIGVGRKILKDSNWAKDAMESLR